ncbi:excinuclease ABC subunit UvrA [Candidatus Dojkabacteria bacterium]|uniref:UvrABC system protein A n=1 Tax=Candidatus Dojkabacteria bacterium TaxID=2099670 RepID=A0A955L746_9BACT|nr:excinuclease ABC subunit UvrA [Candidatus Dojkabacteria bacterium]
MADKIQVRGAKTHNLKNIDVDIPKNKLVVVTGLSGSGKSSLAFDTIYAEGQRKYVESLSAYARQFLGLMEKPDVEIITGLSPAISIDQKSSGHNPRSTVGTITEIYDYLRLLFARVGHARSPITGKRLQRQSVQQIVDTILSLPQKIETDQAKIMLMAPVVKNRKGTYEELFKRFLAQGYVRARVNGEVFSLEETIKLDRYKKHSIEVIIDRLVIKPEHTEDEDFIKRVTDSVEAALNLGEQELLVALDASEVTKEKLEELSAKTTDETWADIFFSENYVDPSSGKSFPEIEPHTFSFNSPHGACKHCNGLGSIKEISLGMLYNPKLSISEGGVYPWAKVADDPNSWSMQQIKAIADVEGFDPRKPIADMTEEQRTILFNGSGKKKYTFTYVRKSDGAKRSYEKPFEGVIPNLMRRYNETDSDYIRKEIEKYMQEMTCPECNGLRLRNYALSVSIHGRNIVDITAMSIEDAREWITEIKSGTDSKEQFISSMQTYLGIRPIEIKEDLLTDQELQIGKQIFREIEARLDFLLAVGLEYLTLSRTAKTLSGGEAQRIRLASQIGTGLTGVLYVLDEPSIGLHQRDNDRLIKTLENLRDIGNTVLVVEHDEDTILTSDYVLDIGPGAGEHGGTVIAEGTPKEIIENPNSTTGQYLSGKKQISRTDIYKEVKEVVPKFDLAKKEKKNKYELRLTGCTHNNLKEVTLEIPLGDFVCVTGVSGSGKSSLINETLYPILAQRLNNAKKQPGNYKEVHGVSNLDKVVNIDQSPIGRTPRSNPATYTGVFTAIRDVFAKTKEARIRGYKPGRFSFNVKGGRCETCKGDGLIKIEMQFLPDVYVTCDTCKGKRYNREALQIDYKGKTIADVLDMTVEEGVEFFANIPSIYNKLKTLNDVGLSYIRLGQSATTLSGGEAQRVKLASELSKRSTGQTIYILDEPTTGLHFEDVRKLLVVLHSLVAKGNTVLVIEHNLDVIKTADWIVDIGPEGGIRGGEIIAQGTPKEIMKSKKSYTGEWLKKLTK